MNTHGSFTRRTGFQPVVLNQSFGTQPNQGSHINTVGTRSCASSGDAGQIHAGRLGSRPYQSVRARSAAGFKAALACLGLSLFTAAAHAEVRLPAIFSDHMVLQRGAEIAVWGWAASGEEVTVSIAGQSKSTKAGSDGKWKLKLTKLKEGGPQTMTVKGSNTITIKDVLVGEVWLGSGQSNMALQVKSANNFEQEQAAANLPQIRMFTERSKATTTAQEECSGEWVVCAPDTVGGFSATSYFFGREIHKALKVPVGLVHSSVGGTPIESWISPEAQQASPELKAFFNRSASAADKVDPAKAKAKYDKDLAKWKEDAKKARAEGKTPPRAPRDPIALRERKGNVGGLFNGKIAPLIPYTIRGALWYQGEANSTPDKAPFYQHQLPLLVKDWRARWGYDFPFAWVQLPNFDGPGRDWPTVREATLKALAVPNTGMAVCIDIGEAKNIHPKNKQEVGRRLASWAMRNAYGHKGSPLSPLYASHRILGKEIELSFTNIECGLVAKGGDLKGFVIAGDDKVWHPALARLNLSSAWFKVIVSSPEVPKPVAVRYGWANNPECNLYSGDLMPASPFRTDDWK